MLVFPQWRPELAAGCRVERWAPPPPDRFAPYLARPTALPPLPPQIEDEESSGGSSPERAVEAGEEEWHECRWRGCGARLPGVARLSAHVARHHAHAHHDGLFYCGWKGCARPQRGFNARYKMLVHVRTHTNERPHMCNQCNKSFSRAENLKIHLRSHSGEKPYVCPYEGCGKAYSNSSDRFKHTRTHTVDKPYCCKVPGCNKRYTDPSSLRKHVKTYKHFATEEAAKRESSEDTRSPIASPTRENVSIFTTVRSPLASPTRENISIFTPTGAQQRIYSPPSTTSPTIPPYNPVLPTVTEHSRLPVGYPHLNQMTYMRPHLEHVYPIRVPSSEMSYLEYTQMYEHAYKNYYTNSINYPVLRQTVIEKIYSYDTKPTVEDVIMKEEQPINDTSERRAMDEMPLNLICTKRLECKPIEDLVRRSDLPLDLSTKT